MVHFSSLQQEPHPMSASAEPRPLTASLELPHPASAVWEVVSDVRRTREWSAECRRVVPLGKVRVGTLLLGLNRRGWVGWPTLSRITSFTPLREIGWVVLTNRAEWRYELTETGTGTTVRQTRRTPRGESRFALLFTRALLGGQADHDTELEEAMTQGLRRIEAIVRADAAEVGNQSTVGGRL
jgi:hypothetical protein